MHAIDRGKGSHTYFLHGKEISVTSPCFAHARFITATSPLSSPRQFNYPHRCRHSHALVVMPSQYHTLFSIIPFLPPLSRPFHHFSTAPTPFSTSYNCRCSHALTIIIRSLHRHTALLPLRPHPFHHLSDTRCHSSLYSFSLSRPLVFHCRKSLYLNEGNVSDAVRFPKERA